MHYYHIVSHHIKVESAGFRFYILIFLKYLNIIHYINNLIIIGSDRQSDPCHRKVIGSDRISLCKVGHLNRLPNASLAQWAGLCIGPTRLLVRLPALFIFFHIFLQHNY